MTYMETVARRFVTRKAAREVIKEIRKAGLDNLRALAEAGQSIMMIYLEGCTPQRKKGIRGELNNLLQMGITPDMLLQEVARQMQEVLSIMVGRDNYRQAEVARLMEFMKAS